MSTAPAPSKKGANAAPRKISPKPRPDADPPAAEVAGPSVPAVAQVDLANDESEFFGDLPARQELPPSLQVFAEGGKDAYDMLIDAARAINPGLPEQLDGCVVTISAQKNGPHIHISADVMALSQHSVTPAPTELDPNPQPIRWRP